jgi:ABC-type glycerol-3-phosphate transport system substrate-binding protein
MPMTVTARVAAAMAASLGAAACIACHYTATGQNPDAVRQ